MRVRFPGWRTGGSFRSLRYGIVARVANRNVDPCWIFWAWNQDAFAALWLVGWGCWPQWRRMNWRHGWASYSWGAQSAPWVCGGGRSGWGRRRLGTEPLPALPVVEQGHFREVKTGVLLLPSERVETSPGRRSVVRRFLVTCLGEADEIFRRLYAQLRELGWVDPDHTV